jgi:RNA polymerase sigma-70 factor (ECF subfamily)
LVPAPLIYLSEDEPEFFRKLFAIDVKIPTLPLDGKEGEFELDLESLVRLAAWGDERAQEALYARFRRQLSRFLHGRVPPEDQPDVIQDTLLAAFNSLKAGRFESRSELGTWLIGILKNKVADYWKGKKRERNIFLSLPDSASPEACAALEIPTQQIPDHSLRLEIEACLEKLPKLHRALFLLSIRDGLTTSQIAGVAEMPLGTVGRVIWEAKQMLRAALLPRKLAGGGDK